MNTYIYSQSYTHSQKTQVSIGSI